MQKRSLPSPAMVIAMLALLAAVGGTAYAAATIGSADVKNNSLKGIDVKNKSLTPRDFRGSVTGPRGPQGARGATGPAGPVNVIQVERSPLVSIPAGQQTGVSVHCPAAAPIAIGGGGTGAGFDTTPMNSNRPLSDGTGWQVDFDNISGSPQSVSVKAVCVAATSFSFQSSSSP